MYVILLLLVLFVPAICARSPLKMPNDVQAQKAALPLLAIGLAIGAISLAVGIYTFLQMRKMQKKNRPKPNQIDGTIADEGVSFCDIAGSPHIHPNITDLWNKKSEAIKQKSGGFLGIGKSSQATGYRYYTSFAAFIGNRIEKFIAINFDNRGWIVHDPTKHPFNLLPVNKPSLFGQDAGGVVGNIDIEFGYPQPQQNLAYKQHFDLVSAYPYQSYLVFRGTGEGKSNEGGLIGGIINALSVGDRDAFYFGNSNYMKEMLLWVKRTRVRNDGDSQWYEMRGDGAIVCEIDGNLVNNREVIPIYEQSAVLSNSAHAELYTDGNLNIIDNESLEVLYNTPAFIFQGNNLTHHGKYPTVGVASDAWCNCSYTFNFGSLIGVFKVTIKYEAAGDNHHFSYTTTAQELGFVIISNEHLEDDSGVGYIKKVVAVTLLLKGNDSFKAQLEAQRASGGESMWVIMSVSAEPLEWILDDGSARGYDINPIHKIREILTDATAMAKPESDVNDANFIKAADRIYDEGLGVSWAIDEKSCIDAIEELCYHIEAGIRVNRQTGLYEMVLFRDDWFAENEIHAIAENKIKDLSLEVMNGDDIVNQLNVTYYDRERIKSSTFSVYENGSILTMGKANAESIDFPYFMNMRNAEVVANWKLKQYSTPAWKGTLTTGWREARKWNRYDLVEITWSKKWQGTILARIMKIDLGNGLNNEVMIDFEEVVPYSGEMNTSIVVDDSAEEKAEPAKPAIGETFEAPYFIAVQNIGQRKVDEELAYNQDVGFTFSTYRRPQWNALYTEITTINADAPENGWVIDGNAEFVTSGQFDQLVSRTMTQIPVKNLQIEGSLNQGDLIVVGSWIIGSVGQYEFMTIESFDAETSILTVKRGALDTIPFEWGVDTNFWNSSPDDGLFSLTEHSAGQNVRASALTVTPSSKLEHLGSAPVYMRSRAIRPYPPANVKINGEYWREYIDNDLVITWSHRNRIQQTSATEVVGWYEGSIAPEAGLLHRLILTERDISDVELRTQNLILGSVDTYTFAKNLWDAGTHSIDIELITSRDGYESLQSFKHTVINSTLVPPSNVTFEVIEY